MRLNGLPPDARAAAPGPSVPEGLSLPEAEKRMMIQALEKARGNKSLAAKMLGISRDALRYRLGKLNEKAAPKP
jgi:DNA-binding NtrC family response regulator